MHRARDNLRRREGLPVIERQEAVNAVLNLVGLSFGDVKTREAYAAALWPHDDHGQRLGMARSQSSCGLTCEAVLRAVGVKAAWLDVPYADSLSGRRLPAVSAQEAVARSRGAWVDAMRWGEERQLPLDGDMVSIGGEAPGIRWSDAGIYGGSHVLTIVGGEKFECLSVDGGQSDPANGGRSTAITRRIRRFDERADDLWLVDPDTGRGRRVRGWIDIGKM